MQTIKAVFTINIPDDIENSQIKEWLAYKLGHRNSMKSCNPLSDTDLEATWYQWCKMHS